MVLEGVGRFAMISAGLTSLSLLLHLIGFATPNWHDNPLVHYGIWRGCAFFVIIKVCDSVTGNKARKIIDSIGDEDTDTYIAWFRGIQACETLGLLALIGVVVLIILKWFKMKDQKSLVILTVIGNFAAAGLILLGVYFWGANLGKQFGFSYCLCHVAALISMAAGFFMYIDYRETTTTTDYRGTTPMNT